MEERIRMELEELRATPEFQKLTGKQKLFVETYCALSESGERNYDPVFATQTAYKCRTPEIARIMSYTLMQNRRILEVLNRHFRRTPTEEFLIALDRAINNKHLSVAQVEALRMKCKIMGYDNHLPVGNGSPLIPKKVAKAAKAERKAKERAARTAKKEKPTKTFFGKD